MKKADAHEKEIDIQISIMMNVKQNYIKLIRQQSCFQTKNQKKGMLEILWHYQMKLRTLHFSRSIKMMDMGMVIAKNNYNLCQIIRSFFIVQLQIVHIQCAKYMKYCFFEEGNAVFHIVYFKNRFQKAFIFHKINIDTVGDKFYLTLKGKVGVYIRLPKPQKQPDEQQNEDIKKDSNELTCVKELESGFAFGELALLNNKPRLATIKCHKDSHFMTLDKLSFILILKQKEEEKLFKEMGYFARLPFFEGWNNNLIKLIYLNSFRIKYKKNESIFQEGDEPASVFIVTEGEFVTQKGFDKIETEDEFGFKQTQTESLLRKEATKQKKQIQLAVLVLNEMFGEEDIMNKNKKRTYSAYCSTLKGECIVVKKRDFLIRILHEEGARMYLEKRLVYKNKHMKEKLQKIQGSIADYQNYIYDDCSEQKQKLQITNAISRIESPKKLQKQQVSFVDLSSQENKDGNQSPDVENQTFTNKSFYNDKSSNSPIMRKQESQSPKNMKRGFSILAVGGPPSISKIQSINNNGQQEEKSSYLRIESSLQKSRTIIELDKVEQKQNKEMLIRKSFTIIDSQNLQKDSQTPWKDSQTPWRDSIAKDYTKNISDTFKSLFSFQQDGDKKSQTSKLLQIPPESSPKRRSSKLPYSQTLVIPHSSTELGGGGFSPKKILGNEGSSPNFKKQLSQVHTPVAQTPYTIFRDNAKSSTSINKLSTILIPKSKKQKNNKDEISTFSIIENSLNYVKNTLSSPTNKIDKKTNENQKQFPKVVLNLDQQNQQQQNNEQNNSQFGIIKLRKSFDNLNSLQEEEDQGQQTQPSENMNLIRNIRLDYFDKPLINKEVDRSQISPYANKKQMLIQNIFQNQQSNNFQQNDNKDSSRSTQQPLLLNLKLINQESDEQNQQKKITKKIESLSQIEDDISSQQNSVDMNKTINSQKKSNMQTSQKYQNPKNYQILSNQSSIKIQQQERQKLQDSMNGVNESISTNQEGKKLSLKIKEKIQSNTQSEYNKISSINSLESYYYFQDSEDHSHIEEINKNLIDKQIHNQHGDSQIKQVHQTKAVHQSNGTQDTAQNQLNNSNQKIIIKKKIIYNSSFSPMKGTKEQPQPYKFEQYKNNYHVKKLNHNPSQRTSQTEYEESLNSSFKLKITRENTQSYQTQKENKSNEIAESYFVSAKPRSEKQITSYQKLGHMKQRNINRSIDYQNGEKSNQSIGINNFVNQTALTRFDHSKDSISPSISPDNRLIGETHNLNYSDSQKKFSPIAKFNDNLIKSQIMKKSNTLKLNQINEKQFENQIQIEPNSNPNLSKQIISKHSFQIRSGVLSPDKQQIKQKIIFGDNKNTSMVDLQKRFSSMRTFNKSENQLIKTTELFQSNPYLQNQDQSHNISQNEKQQHHPQNLSISQKIQPTHYNYQNIRQTMLPFNNQSEQASQSTIKKAVFQEKMRQQIQSQQNLARSSINNPYTNLTLIKQHQQLHKHINNKLSLIQKISQQNQSPNMKNQSAHQL